MFITLEGIDNVGKTTICSILAERLRNDYRILVISDPPRMLPWTLFMETMLGKGNITPIGRAVIFLAARVDTYCRVVKPAIERGYVVLGDRSVDSWHAYQSVINRSNFETSRAALKFFHSITKIFVQRGYFAPPDKTS